MLVSVLEGFSGLYTIDSMKVSKPRVVGGNAVVLYKEFGDVAVFIADVVTLRNHHSCEVV